MCLQRLCTNHTKISQIEDDVFNKIKDTRVTELGSETPAPRLDQRYRVKL